MIKRLYKSRRPFANTLAYSALLFFITLLPCLLSAQTPVEICDNGIDDDGDGLIDCYDQDCTCTGQCDNFYYTTCNADCFFLPTCDTINLGIQWVGQAETGTYSTLIAGDMDRDGIPEIVTSRVESPDIYIIDGATGATKVHIVNPTDLPGGTTPAMADLNNDGFGEFVFIGNDRLLRCYGHTGALLFTSPAQVGYHSGYSFSVPSIADVDQDGLPEIIVGNQVFSGQTGALRAQAGAAASAGEHPARRAKGFSFAMPVAIDALPDNFCPDCAGLEIVAGNQVFSVNLVTGVATPEVSAPAQFTDGFTSIADFDRDGDLDAIVQGKKGTQNTVYCWDIQTPTILREFQLPTNWSDGASRVNVADLDGDGQLEISFVEFPNLYALKNDFTPLWTVNAIDPSSITCSSVYDFCGDGSSDVIYRGVSFLQVIEGATGQVKWQDNCLSATHIENPLVLDVDGDGQTEIVIECGTNGTPDKGSVIAYEAVGLPGISSRRVWNQHAYFNTNINEDLSVPRIQQNPHIVGDSLRVNSFLNQFFNPTFPAPDGAVVTPTVACAGDSLDITLSVCNYGDKFLPLQTPVSAYRGNPQTSAALWLGAVPIGFDLAPDSCRTLHVRLPRLANDSLFLVLNDNHSRPTPFDLGQDFPVTAIGECAFVNNITAIYFSYNPAKLNLGPDSLICDNATLLLNAGGTDLVGWQWHDASSQPTFLAPDAGVYAVTVTDICGITQTDSRVIGIDSSTVLGLGPDQVICQGETVSLGQAGFDQYTWLPAPAVNCPNCAAVQAGPSASGYVSLRASLNNGCFSIDSVYVTVYDTFNYKIDTTICYGRTVDWNGFSIKPDSSRTFSLQTLHGCDSTVQVRVHGTTIGTYQIQVDTAVCLGDLLPYNGFLLQPGEQKTFLLSASTGCDSAVMVHVLPKDTFATNESPVICNGETAVVFGQPQTTSGIFQKTFTARNGCDSTHTVQLTVLPPIQLALDATSTCLNESDGVVTAEAGGGTPPFSYAWTVAGQNQAVLNNVPAGSYGLTVTDAKDCTRAASATVPNYPPIVFTPVPDSVQCFGQKNGAIGLSSPDSTLTYSLDGNAYGQTDSFTNLAAGSYTVFAQDSYGCIETGAVYVPQPPEVVLSLPDDATVLLGDSLPLNIVLPNADLVQYAWENSAYLSCIDCPDPYARPLDDIHYVLTVTNASGCSATDDMFLTVDKRLLTYIPNALAPDAPLDQLNGRFTPSFGPSVQLVKSLRIFDRWGTLVYEVRDGLPNDDNRAWDGTSRGKAVSPGVYVWQLELELVDGRKEIMSGDVTVLR